MDNAEYAKELAKQYDIDPEQDYGLLISGLEKKLDAYRNELQKLYKMKAGVQRMQEAAGGRFAVKFGKNTEGIFNDRRSGKVYSTDFIKDFDEELIDKKQSIGELETSILLLKHNSSDTSANMLNRENGFSDDTINATLKNLQRQLEIEMQVKIGAEKLMATYKSTSKAQFEAAKGQFESAASKIGFIRNQIIRTEQAISANGAAGDGLGLANGLPSERLGPRLSDAWLWDAQMADLKHRITVEHAIMYGSRNAMLATGDRASRQKAAVEVRESIQKLCLLQIHLRELLKNEPRGEERHRSIVDEAELATLLASPFQRVPSGPSPLGQPRPLPSAISKDVTGMVEIRISGCHDLLDVFPAFMVYGDFICFNRNYPANVAPNAVLTSKLGDTHWSQSFFLP